MDKGTEADDSLPEYEFDYSKAKPNRFNSKMSTVERFSELLAQWAHGFVSQSSTTGLTVSLPDNFHPDEANGFLRALDNGILRVSDSGRCSLPTIHRAKKPTEPCLFSINKHSVVCLVWREYITQIGMVADLVLDYGWPQELVALDPRDTTFDTACYSSSSATATMLVAGEAKKTIRELAATRTKLLDASRLRLSIEQLPPGQNKDANKRLPDDHKKYRGLLAEKPQFFWLVAPGAKWSYQVFYEIGAAVLEEISDLPTYFTINGIRG